MNLDSGRWPQIALIVALQIALLMSIFAPRMLLLATGTEVVLDVTPIDPRSLFRGDYVIITTEAHRLPQDASGRRARRSTTASGSGAAMYAVLERDGTKAAWRVKSVSPDRPASVGAGDIVMKGRRTAGSSGISYGIESYFVPEGTGKAIEKAITSKSVTVKLAIDGAGTAAIKSLMIDGKAVHSTSLL